MLVKDIVGKVPVPGFKDLVKTIALEKPFTLVVERLNEVELPAIIVEEGGVQESVKSGGPPTVTVTLAEADPAGLVQLAV